MLLEMIQWLNTVTSWWCNKKDNLVCFIVFIETEEGLMYPSPVTMLHSPLQKLMAGKKITVRYTLKTWYLQPSINNRSFLICEQFFKRNAIFRIYTMYSIVSNLLVPNPTNKIHHNLSRKRIDISCWPWWGITIPSGGFFAQRLAAQVLGFQGSPCPLDQPPPAKVGPYQL